MLAQLFWDIVVLVGNVTAFWGWLKHQSVLCVAVGTAICLVDTAMRWKDLNRNARWMDAFAFVVGLIVGLCIKNTPAPYICGMLAINAQSIFVQTLAMLFRVGAFVSALPSYTEKIKAWLSMQKPLLIFLSLILAVVLLVKLLDAEFARGRASGIEYAKEELVSASYDNGYEDGRASAIEEHSGDYDEGYEVGYERASTDLKDAYLSSLEQVYDEAYDEGYDTGYEDGQAEVPTVTGSGSYSEDEIYRKAYSYAEDQLRHEYEEMIADAYDNGYDNGYSDGEDSVGR